MTNEKMMQHNIVRALEMLEQSALALKWIGENFNEACKDNAWEGLKKTTAQIEFAQTAANNAANRLTDANNWLDNARQEYISFQMELEDIHESNTP